MWITGLCILPNVSEAAPSFLTAWAETSTTTGNGCTLQVSAGTAQPHTAFLTSSSTHHREAFSASGAEDPSGAVVVHASTACLPGEHHQGSPGAGG